MMKNNYDLIFNFETNDGSHLTEETITHILDSAYNFAKELEAVDGVTIWKAIIAQAMDSRRLS